MPVIDPLAEQLQELARRRDLTGFLATVELFGDDREGKPADQSEDREDRQHHHPTCNRRPASQKAGERSVAFVALRLYVREHSLDEISVPRSLVGV